MKCPSCHSNLGGPVNNCPICKYHFEPEIFDMMSIFFKLKKERERLNHVTAMVSKAVKNITADFTEFENFINNDFQRAFSRASELNDWKNRERAKILEELKKEFETQIKIASVTAPEDNLPEPEKAGQQTAAKEIIEKTDAAAKEIKQENIEEQVVAIANETIEKSDEKTNIVEKEIEEENITLKPEPEEKTSQRLIAKEEEICQKEKEENLSAQNELNVRFTGADFHEKEKNQDASKPEEPLWTIDFEVIFGQQWLLIIGIITMLFGVGYFLKYSFDQGWIGDYGKVALAYLWGAAFLGVGHYFHKKKYEMFGLYLIGGGIAVLYFSTYAAFAVYKILEQLISFTLMVLITGLAGSLSIIYDTKWLSVLGIIGGFLTPGLVGNKDDSVSGLFAYMTFLNAGILWIAFYKKWDLLNTLGFVFTYIVFISWFNNTYDNSKFWPAIIFLNIYFFMYTIIPYIYQVFRDIKEDTKAFHIMLPNTLLAFGFSYHMIKAAYCVEWVSVITLLYAAVFLYMASYLFNRGKQSFDAFIILLSKASLFLIITVPMIFSQNWITIFWAAQALVLLWMGIKLNRLTLTAGSYVLMAISVFKFLLYDYQEIFGFDISRCCIAGSYTTMIAGRYITTAFILIALYYFAKMIRPLTKDRLVISDFIGDDYSVVVHIFLSVLFISLNVEVVSLFNDILFRMKFGALSILWVAFAMGLLRLGIKLKQLTLVFWAYILMGISVIKFMIYDYSAVFGFNISSYCIADSYTYMMAERYITTLFILTALYYFSKMFKRMIKDEVFQVTSTVNELYSITFILLLVLFISLNIEVVSLFSNIFFNARFAAISILWVVFAAGLIMKGYDLDIPVMRNAGFLMICAAYLKYMLYDYSNVFMVTGNFLIRESYTNMIFVRFFTTAIFLLAIYWLMNMSKRKPNKLPIYNLFELEDSSVLYSVWLLTLFIVLNIENCAFFGYYLPAARMTAVSVLWTFYSTGLMAVGFYKKSEAYRKVSLGLFMFTLLKVFMVDMVSFSTPYRILSFMILGLVLIGMSYLYHKFKDMLVK